MRAILSLDAKRALLRDFLADGYLYDWMGAILVGAINLVLPTFVISPIERPFSISGEGEG